MKVAGILLDLDGTLVDTNELDALRHKKDWRGCVAGLNKTVVYDGISDLLQRASEKGVCIGIVTTSVSYYAQAVLRHHNLKYDVLVAYHDAKPKPAPDPYLLAIKKLSLTTNTVIGIGDTTEDALSLNAAKIIAIGAGWSSVLQKNASWDKIAAHPSEITL